MRMILSNIVCKKPIANCRAIKVLLIMKKILHGIDLVDCPRIEQMLQRHDRHFLDRVFTPTEQQQANEIKNRVERLCGRFAAKEAVLKLLGTGWRGKIAWTDIEIINNPLGRPQVTLSGEVKKIASKLGVGEISLSISHTANFVMASATALTE
jgi:holo-[acyl-carrier protein] synthase